MKNHLWNMFASLKNGQIARKNVILQTRTNFCERFLKILWDEGFILGYKISDLDANKLIIFLKYTSTGKPVINSIKTLSKPGKRLFYSVEQIWKIDSSKAFIIFSTNKGLKSIHDCKKQHIGGEAFIIIN